MASNVQKPLHTCSDHEHEETDMYCKTCKKPVCVQCVKNEHKEHEWDSMKNVAKNLRPQTIKRKLEMTSISKSIVIGVSEILDSVSDRSDQQFSSNCSELESTRKELVRYVNEEIDKMKAKCEDYHETKAKTVQELRDKLKRKGNRMDFLIHEMETGATDFTDFDLIEMHEELKRLLNELHSLADIPSNLHNDTVYARVLDVSIIKTLLGSVEEKQSSRNPVLKHKFRYNEKKNSASKLILRICLMKENEAWICNAGSTSLVDSEGNEKRSINMESNVTDITVAENDMIYFCDWDAACVTTIDRDEKITTLFSTAPFAPSSICFLRSGDLLISSAVKKTIDKEKYLVRRTSKTGDVIKDYKIGNDGEKSYFSFPWQVIEHFNGNIGILIWFSEKGKRKFSTIVTIDHEETIVFKYGDEEDNLHIASICCDIKGITLAAEPIYNRIHVIDAKGSLVRYLFTEESFQTRPSVIALLGCNLWVGNLKTGMIEVYKYVD